MMMNMLKQTFISLIILFLPVPTVFSQVKEAWVATHFSDSSNPSNSDYAKAHSVKPDGFGNVYVVGTDCIDGGHNCSFATIKYDSGGEQLWIARYSDPIGKNYAETIAVDKAGNVYVTGKSQNEDMSLNDVTIKYNSEGKELWVARNSEFGNGFSYAPQMIVLDATGNVYIISTRYSESTGIDYITIKYSNDGKELWIARYNGPGSSSDYPYALAVDSEENVYVTGLSYSEKTNGDYTTIKYNKEGEVVWVARYDGPDSGYDGARDIALDKEGNVYVTGSIVTSIAERTEEFATIKYTNDGEEVWVAHQSGPSKYYNSARDLEIDAAGNVYITGQSWNWDTVGMDTHKAYFVTIKYNNNGEKIWESNYSSPLGGELELPILAIDTTGNAYVSGIVFPEDGSIFCTIKYDSTGKVKWVADYKGIDCDYNKVRDLSVDTTGNVYITGTSSGYELGISNHIVTIKYSEDLPPVVYSSKLYFPHVASGPIWETEICIINSNTEQSLAGELKAYDNSGQEISSTLITLPPNARREITIGDELPNPSSIGYVIFESDSENVRGYTKFYSEGKYRAAVPATPDLNSGDVYISHIASGPQWWTGISIMNTTSAPKNLTIEFDNGEIKTMAIAAKEHKVFTIANLFDGVAQPNIRSGVIKNASGIIGLELFGSSPSSGNSYLSGVLLKDDTTTEIFYPHVVSSAIWWTGIVAYNPSSVSSDITVTPFKSDGTPLTPQSITLAPKGKYVGTAAQLNFPEGTAWFRIDATSPITGFELFGTNNGKQLGGYTGVGISGTDGVFAKIEKDGWTGISFVNIESSPAIVTITAHNDDGSAIATKTLNLAGYEKVLGIAQDLFSQDISAATYIRYSSNGEIVGFQLNGSSDGMMLDGLPGM